MRATTKFITQLLLTSMLCSSLSFASQEIRLKGPKGFDAFDSSLVEMATLRLFPEPKDMGKKSEKTVYLDGKVLQSFLKNILFDAPKEPGVPAAMITGELVLSIKSTKIKAITDHKFKIYNGRLLNDLESPEVYYFVKKPIQFSGYK